MKKLILSALLAVAVILPVHAQNPPAKAVTQSLLGTAPIRVGHIVTNLTTAQRPWCGIGGNGFAVSFTVGATNALATSNVIVRLEFSNDQVNVITLPSTVTPLVLSFAPNGTNLQTFSTNWPAANQWGNIAFVRLKSLENTNAADSAVGGVWFTNAYLLSR